MTLLAPLARFSAELEGRAIPHDVREAARIQLLDMIAALHATERSGACEKVERAITAMASSGRATTFATGARRSPVDAAWVNAAYSMAHDYDDVVWMGHTCHSAVFAALAVGEHEGASLDDVLSAVVIANEIGGRLGAACFLGPLNGQMWTFVHLAAAAAGTARLLGLDAERTMHALAIALAQPPFALQPGFLVPTSKLLAASTPIAIGIRAAYLAREGITGAPDILEDRRGFFRRFAYRPLPAMLEDLGRFWVSETLTIKTWPGCHYFQTALEAIAKMQARGPIALDDVREVRIETTKLACEATKFAREYVAEGSLTAVNANFDLALSAAILLHAGRLTVEELEERWLAENAEALRAWRRKIVVVHAPDLTARVIATGKKIEAAQREMKAIGVRDLLGLVRRYREDYASELVPPRELLASIVTTARALTSRERHEEKVRMEFPSRVTVERTGGRRETERVDLPAGAFGGGAIEREIERKVLREARSEAQGRALLRAASGDSLEALIAAATVGAAR